MEVMLAVHQVYPLARVPGKALGLEQIIRRRPLVRHGDEAGVDFGA